MLNKNQYEKYFYFGILFGVLLLLLNLYYYAHPLWKESGMSWQVLDSLCKRLAKSPLFSHSLKTKVAALMLISLGMLSKSSKAREVDLKIVAIVGALSAAAYVMPFPRLGLYVFFTIVGCVGLIWVVSMIARRETKAIINDDNETFPQCPDKIANDDSINLPIVYQYQQKMHNGWINVVNPFRGILVLGSPGSGKSYSVYEPIIDQMMYKGYTMCVYDYKYPTLSKNVYNKLLQYRHKYDVKPEFCLLNFDDPMHSLRANPTHPSYIMDQADCAEIAELIMLNINKVAREKNDFFTESSKALLDGVFWYLRTHENGRYCTFPHAIEFLNQDYRKVIAILISDPDVKTKISSFSDALNAGANDQLQGMIASTRIPLSKFTSRNLYWILTGDDFNLDINDPDHPKILCIGNNPDREIIYGTCIALYTSRMFKRVNHPGRVKCGVLLDEMPTIFLPGVDKILNTCRSNGVVFVVGGQDVSQFYRDYGKKEADVLINTPGTTFIGQVNGESAKTMSQVFGKLDRLRESESIGRSNDSVSIS
ncbi:MAG: type IV secretion system DNA-binding domain-containing protein, partial [Bacteroidales bacterium]|nr:type IV secretion system DNA-binding domain-containing protein [Bacteroidales bacterium]